MGKVVDIKGQKFGRLTTIEYKGLDKFGKALWLCKCDCGNEITTSSNLLRGGHTRSCGCLQKEAVSRTGKSCTIHGATVNGKRDPLYVVWCSIRQRCENINNKDYHNYGERGITVCSEWQTFMPFREWALENGWQQGLTIDRIDNNSGYRPDNCRFVTIKENNRNKRNNYIVHYGGRDWVLGELAEYYKISPYVLYRRIKLGWPLEKALFKKVG